MRYVVLTVDESGQTTQKHDVEADTVLEAARLVLQDVNGRIVFLFVTEDSPQYRRNEMMLKAIVDNDANREENPQN